MSLISKCDKVVYLSRGSKGWNVVDVGRRADKNAREQKYIATNLGLELYADSDLLR